MAPWPASLICSCLKNLLEGQTKNSKSCLALRRLIFLLGQAGAPPTLIKGLTSLLSKGASLPTPSLTALLSLLQLPCLSVGVPTEDATNNELSFIQGTLAKGDVANSLTSLLRSNLGNQVTVLLRGMRSKEGQEGGL